MSQLFWREILEGTISVISKDFLCPTLTQNTPNLGTVSVKPFFCFLVPMKTHFPYQTLGIFRLAKILQCCLNMLLDLLSTILILRSSYSSLRCQGISCISENFSVQPNKLTTHWQEIDKASEIFILIEIKAKLSFFFNMYVIDYQICYQNNKELQQLVMQHV